MDAKHYCKTCIMLMLALSSLAFSSDYFDCVAAPLHPVRIDCEKILWTAPPPREIWSQGSSQWYRIDVATPGRLDVELANLRGKNFDLYVYESCGSLEAPRCQSKNGTGYDDSCVFDADRGHYYVRIKQVAGSGGYSLMFGIMCVAHEDISNYDHYNCSEGSLYWYDSNNLRKEVRQECGESSCDEWGENFCQGTDVIRARTCYDRGCMNGGCFENIYSEPELVRPCGGAGCSDGACNGSLYEYDGCHDNDVYEFSGMAPKTRKQECGEDSCGELGEGFCQSGNVYRARTCHDRGCSEGKCFENIYSEPELAETCGRGCDNAKCVPWWSPNYAKCYGNDLYEYFLMFRGKMREDCGDSSMGAWGKSYCRDGNIYQNRTDYARGCSGYGCFERPLFYDRMVQDCGGNGCSNGSCNVPYVEHMEYYCYNDDLYVRNSSNPWSARIFQDCGESRYGEWGDSFCENGSVYRSRNVRGAGCSDGACFADRTRLDKQMAFDCGGAGCSDGACNVKSGIKLIDYTSIIETGYIGYVSWEASEGFRETGVYVDDPMQKSTKKTESDIYDGEKYYYMIMPKSQNSDHYLTINVYGIQMDGSEEILDPVRILITNGVCMDGKTVYDPKDGTRYDCDGNIPYYIESIDEDAISSKSKDNFSYNLSAFYHDVGQSLYILAMPFIFLKNVVEGTVTWTYNSAECEDKLAEYEIAKKIYDDNYVSSGCEEVYRMENMQMTRTNTNEEQVCSQLVSQKNDAATAAMPCKILNLAAENCVDVPGSSSQDAWCYAEIGLIVLGDEIFKIGGNGLKIGSRWIAKTRIGGSTIKYTKNIWTFCKKYGIEKISHIITKIKLRLNNGKIISISTKYVDDGGELAMRGLGKINPKTGFIESKYPKLLKSILSKESDDGITKAIASRDSLVTKGFTNDELETLLKKGWNMDYLKNDIDDLIRKGADNNKLHDAIVKYPSEVMNNGRLNPMAYKISSLVGSSTDDAFRAMTRLESVSNDPAIIQKTLAERIEKYSYLDDIRTNLKGKGIEVKADASYLKKVDASAAYDPWTRTIYYDSETKTSQFLHEMRHAYQDELRGFRIALSNADRQILKNDFGMSDDMINNAIRKLDTDEALDRLLTQIDEYDAWTYTFNDAKLANNAVEATIADTNRMVAKQQAESILSGISQ